MLHVCESPHPVNTHRPSASRGAGVPYVLSASRVASTVCLTYLCVSVRESPAAAIDLATGNRNVD